jgi:hypothetical protein
VVDYGGSNGIIIIPIIDDVTTDKNNNNNNNTNNNNNNNNDYETKKGCTHIDLNIIHIIRVLQRTGIDILWPITRFMNLSQALSDEQMLVFCLEGIANMIRINSNSDSLTATSVTDTDTGTSTGAGAGAGAGACVYAIPLL